MKISYNWLNTYFKKGLLSGGLPKPEKLAELFNAHAFEVEGVEKISGDTVLDIKVLPDRAHYALCHRGIAREASVISDIPLKNINQPHVVIDSSVPVPGVAVQEPALCYRYTARKIDGVKVIEKSQFKTELEAIGARSINNVVDATNFVMFDLGQPLHAFDADKIVGGITVRLAKAGEKIILLDGREVALLETDLVIADDVEPLAIAGVKGGKRAEVTLETRSIILESANFNPTSVRRTSTRLNLRNDSSKRFENEITPVLAIEAMEHVTAHILAESKGAKVGAVVDVYPNPVKPWSVEVDALYISSVLGGDILTEEIVDTLLRLGCAVETKGNILKITPPFDRLDLKIPEDIADEVGRIRGYGGLVAKQTPHVETTLIDKTFYYSEKIKNILVGLGFSEVITYSFVPLSSQECFEITYPLAKDKSALRASLYREVSRVLSFSLNEAPLLGIKNEIKIFEMGKVFRETGEITLLCFGVEQFKKQKGITAESQISDAMKSLHGSFNIEFNGDLSKFTVMRSASQSQCVIEINLDEFVSRLPEPTSVSDLNFTALSRDIKYKPFSHYPFIVRDIAFFAPIGTEETKARTVVADVARASSGDLLIKGPDMFDKFEKGEKVSFGFRMIFQSFERTLSDDEVNLIMESVYRSVKDSGWEVR